VSWLSCSKEAESRPNGFSIISRVKPPSPPPAVAGARTLREIICAAVPKTVGGTERKKRRLPGSPLGCASSSALSRACSSWYEEDAS